MNIMDKENSNIEVQQDESLYGLENINSKRIIIKNGKIIIKSFFYGLFDFGFPGIFIFCVLFFLGLINIGYYVALLSTYQKISSLIFLITPFIWILLLVGLNKRYVIDYRNGLMYYAVNLFSIQLFRYNIIEKDSIITICNNVHGNLFGRKYSMASQNEVTKLYHDYYLSILMEDGKLFDFVLIGEYEDDYQNGVDIAKAISEFWGVSVQICNNFQCFKVEENRKGFTLIPQKVKFNSKPNIKTIIIVVVLIVIFYIFALFMGH